MEDNTIEKIHKLIDKYQESVDELFEDMRKNLGILLYQEIKSGMINAEKL